MQSSRLVPAGQQGFPEGKAPDPSGLGRARRVLAPYLRISVSTMLWAKPEFPLLREAILKMTGFHNHNPLTCFLLSLTLPCRPLPPALPPSGVRSTWAASPVMWFGQH